MVILRPREYLAQAEEHLGKPPDSLNHAIRVLAGKKTGRIPSHLAEALHFLELSDSERVKLLGYLGDAEEKEMRKSGRRTNKFNKSAWVRGVLNEYVQYVRNLSR